MEKQDNQKILITNLSHIFYCYNKTCKDGQFERKLIYFSVLEAESPTLWCSPRKHLPDYITSWPLALWQGHTAELITQEDKTEKSDRKPERLRE